MSEFSFLYLIFPLAMGIIWLISKDTELPPGIEDTGISRAYLQIALFIYTNWCWLIKQHCYQCPKPVLWMPIEKVLFS